MSTTNTCGNCANRIKCSSGKGWAMYCDVHASRRTRNRKLRIKGNQPACELHKYSSTPLDQVPSNQLSLFD